MTHDSCHVARMQGVQSHVGHWGSREVRSSHFAERRCADVKHRGKAEERGLVTYVHPPSCHPLIYPQMNFVLLISK